MDQQNESTSKQPEKHIPTAAEIARLEAEAAAALQRGEAPAGRRPDAPAGSGADAPKAPAQPEFVPYVDDVVEPPAPAPEAELSDDDDEEYIPSKWEVWVNGLPPERWKWIQIAGGALLGLVALALLLIGGEELATYRLIVAARVALLVPRYGERVIRRDLVAARRAMIVALLIGLVVTFLILGAQNGFQFRKVE